MSKLQLKEKNCVLVAQREEYMRKEYRYGNIGLGKGMGKVEE